MFRTAFRQSARLFAASSLRVAARAPMAAGVRAFPATTIAPRVSIAPRVLGGVRCYSSGGPPSREDIEARIMDLLKGFDKITDPSKITSTSHFSNDLGLDSLDTVEVVMAIEEEFSVEIPDKQAEAILSVGDAVEYIANQPGAV
ncbi:hypothetical protein TWF696_004817 [Orbilia brochopaga]|uniref:Acyl carrier protein n=1 Tax=Orbilia brochopaga TaxID=3140254 RepID=A0AAV9UZR8_9PEZI